MQTENTALARPPSLGEQVRRLTPPAARHAERVLVIGLDGGTYDVLAPLAAAGVMPNLARWMAGAALAVLQSTRPCVTPAAWTTFQTGVDPEAHGILDFRHLDHRAGQLLLNHAGLIRCPTLFDAVSEAGGEVASLGLPMTYPSPSGVRGIVVGGFDSPSPAAALAAYPEFAQELAAAGATPPADAIWKRKPASFAELSAHVRRTQEAFRAQAVAARLADRRTDWRLLIVQFQALDAIQHRCWHLLGVAGPDTDTEQAPPEWVDQVQAAFRTLDNCLGELLSLASQRGAAVVVASDHGFGPFRGGISMAELFQRRGLLTRAGWRQRLGYRLARAGTDTRKRLWRRRHAGASTAGLDRPLAGALPIDWRRSVAIPLHGDLAGLIYLNRPERFQGGPLATPRLVEQATCDVLAAVREAHHPQTGEPLFDEVYATAERLGADAIERLWPDVVALPAAGWHCRNRMGGSQRLIAEEPTLTGTHRAQGVLMVEAPDVRTGGSHAVHLRDVAPTILGMLGLTTPGHVTGRVVQELFDASPSSAPRAAAPTPAATLAPAISAAEQAVVESRLRDLGYLD